jgi:hypothetical protein
MFFLWTYGDKRAIVVEVIEPRVDIGLEMMR